MEAPSLQSLIQHNLLICFNLYVGLKELHPMKWWITIDSDTPWLGWIVDRPFVKNLEPCSKETVGTTVELNTTTEGGCIALRGLRAFYFSVVTMTTLGFGDIPANPLSWEGHVLVMIQVFLGYILLAAFVTRMAILFQEVA
jgi:hypothetical protein